MGPVRTLVSLSGRLPRRGFAVILVAVLALVAGGALLLAATATVPVSAIDPTVPTILLWGAIASAVWLVLAAGVRRLHDRDRSGFALLLFAVLPWALVGLGTLDRHGPGEAAADLLAAGLAAWGGIEMLLRPGTRGANRYGPDPLGDREGAPTPPTGL